MKDRAVHLDDGTTAEDTLSASIIVIVAPCPRLTLADPLDDPMTVGETYDATLDIANLCSSDVELTQIHMTGDNLTITEGAETLLEALQSDDDTLVSFSLEPVAVGNYTLVAELAYLDDLNQTQTYTVEFSGTVEQATRPQMPTRDFTPPTETTQEDDVVGRLLLGFLGLGLVKKQLLDVVYNRRIKGNVEGITRIDRKNNPSMSVPDLCIARSAS